MGRLFLKLNVKKADPYFFRERTKKMRAGFQKGLSISKLVKVAVTVTIRVISQPSRLTTKYRIKYFSFLGADLRLQRGFS